MDTIELRHQRNSNLVDRGRWQRTKIDGGLPGPSNALRAGLSRDDRAQCLQHDHPHAVRSRCFERAGQGTRGIRIDRMRIVDKDQQTRVASTVQKRVDRETFEHVRPDTGIDTSPPTVVNQGVTRQPATIGPPFRADARRGHHCAKPRAEPIRHLRPRLGQVAQHCPQNGKRLELGLHGAAHAGGRPHSGTKHSKERSGEPGLANPARAAQREAGRTLARAVRQCFSHFRVASDQRGHGSRTAKTVARHERLGFDRAHCAVSGFQRRAGLRRPVDRIAMNMRLLVALSAIDRSFGKRRRRFKPGRCQPVEQVPDRREFPLTGGAQGHPHEDSFFVMADPLGSGLASGTPVADLVEAPEQTADRYLAPVFGIGQAHDERGFPPDAAGQIGNPAPRVIGWLEPRDDGTSRCAGKSGVDRKRRLSPDQRLLSGHDALKVERPDFAPDRRSANCQARTGQMRPFNIAEDGFERIGTSALDTGGEIKRTVAGFIYWREACEGQPRCHLATAADQSSSRHFARRCAEFLACSFNCTGKTADVIADNKTRQPACLRLGHQRTRRRHGIAAGWTGLIVCPLRSSMITFAINRFRISTDCSGTDTR